MDLKSIVTGNGKIHKRLDPNSDSTSIQNQYESDNQNKDLKSTAVDDKKSIDYSDSKPEVSELGTNRPKRVDKSVNTGQPLQNIPIKSSESMQTPFKNVGVAVSEGAKDLVSDLKNNLNVLAPYTALFTNRKSHINLNPKTEGRFLFDQLNILKGSVPYTEMPWSENLRFLENIPNLSQFAEFTKEWLIKEAKILLESGKEDPDLSAHFNEAKERAARLAEKKEIKLESTNFRKSQDNAKKLSETKSFPKIASDTISGTGHSKKEYGYNISESTQWSEKYEINNDKHLGPYFKGYADISMFEGREDRYYDFEIYTPSELKSKGLPVVPTSASGLKIDKAANLNQITMISMEGGETYNLGEFGAPIRSLKLNQNVAQISTDIYETEKIEVRKWLEAYKKYMYGDNPTPLVHRSIYVGYYYLTFYYLDVDRSTIMERTFYGVPTFDLSITPEPGQLKKFPIQWMIIGESNNKEQENTSN